MAPIIEEGTHKVDGGLELYTKTWKTSSPPKARLLFIHGFSDHCNNYGDFFTRLTDQGIEVYAFDQRGWGRSVRSKADRGLTGPTSTVLNDITSMLRTLVVVPPPAPPLFVMGHSMGGAETLHYAAAGPRDALAQVTGFVASAPLVALHAGTRPSRATVVLGRLAGRVLPRRQLVNKLNPDFLSRDAAENAKWVADELCHDTGTLEGLAGMLDRGEQLESGAVLVQDGVGVGGKTRLLLVHGTADRVNDFDASKTYFDRLDVEDKEFKAYDGWYHNLHVEPGQDKFDFSNDIARWILDRADAGAASSPAEAHPKL
ncbi:hypothetical protein MBLNU459_g4884t1 [Dothideomycetes sp. NU459]